MGAVREDMDDERDNHRETLCVASLCYLRDHSSTDVQSRHCPSRATTVAVHKSCGGCHANHNCLHGGMAMWTVFFLCITTESPFPTPVHQPITPDCSKLRLGACNLGIISSSSGTPKMTN